MHQKHPFRTRKGDTGFNPIQIPASKGDDGFRQPTQLAYRARLRCPWATAGPGQTTSQRPEPHVGTPGAAGVEGAGGMEGQAAVPVGGGGAWPGFEATHQATRQRTRSHWCGGRRRDRRARAGFKTKHNHTSAHQAPRVWRAPEGPEGTGGLRDRPLRAAGSRVAISRAAGPSGARNTSGATSNTINDSGRRPRAHQAARPNNTPRGARNTSGATRHIGTTKPPSPTGAGRLRQSERVSAGSRRCPDHRDRFPDGRSKCQA